MFGKILITAAVIALAYFYLRYRPNPTSVPRTKERLPSPQGLSPRQMAYVILGVIIVISVAAASWRWWEHHRVVSIRVFNTQTGKVVSYMARRGALHGRVFETLDGRTIRLAAVERIETLELE